MKKELIKILDQLDEYEYYDSLHVDIAKELRQWVDTDIGENQIELDWLYNRLYARTIPTSYDIQLLTYDSDDNNQPYPNLAEPDTVLINITFTRQMMNDVITLIAMLYWGYDCSDCCNAIETAIIGRGWLPSTNDKSYSILFTIKPSYHS